MLKTRIRKFEISKTFEVNKLGKQIAQMHKAFFMLGKMTYIISLYFKQLQFWHVIKPNLLVEKNLVLEEIY